MTAKPVKMWAEIVTHPDGTELISVDTISSTEAGARAAAHWTFEHGQRFARVTVTETEVEK